MFRRQQAIVADFTQHWLSKSWFIDDDFNSRYMWWLCIDRNMSILTYTFRRSMISEKRREFFSTIAFRRRTLTETHSIWIDVVVYFTQNQSQFWRTRIFSKQIFDRVRILFTDFMIWCKVFRNHTFWSMHRDLLNKRNASHQALFLFSIDFNVYIFEHVNEHITFVNRALWLCYVIMLSKHIVLLLLEHDNKHIVFWNMSQISFDV